MSTGVATYLVLLVVPWVLVCLAWRLQVVGSGLENMRLFLYVLIVLVSGVAAFTIISSEAVVINVLETTTAPEVDVVSGANANSGPHTYSYVNHTSIVNTTITLYDRDAGVGGRTDALTLAGLYGGLSLLFLVLSIAEVFRLAEVSMANARRIDR